ncbi:MAG: thioredoxin family protein, partial [Methanotrichaceae archaeon]
MYNSRIIVYLVLVSLVAFSPIIASAANQQSSSNSSQGLIFELNDSLVNGTISKYPFFVLDCYASWCEPCKEMNDTLHQLSSELNGQIVFGTIDVGNNSKVAQRYNITDYPT